MRAVQEASEPVRSQADATVDTMDAENATALTDRLPTAKCESCGRPAPDRVVLQQCGHALCYVCLAFSVLKHTRRAAMLWRNASHSIPTAQQIFFPLEKRRPQSKSRSHKDTRFKTAPFVARPVASTTNRLWRTRIIKDDPHVLRTIPAPFEKTQILLPKDYLTQEKQPWNCGTYRTPWADSRRMKDEFWVSHPGALNTAAQEDPGGIWSSVDGLLPDVINKSDDLGDPSTPGSSVCPLCGRSSTVTPEEFRLIASQLQTHDEALSASDCLTLIPMDLTDMFTTAVAHRQRLYSLPSRTRESNALRYHAPLAAEKNADAPELLDTATSSIRSNGALCSPQRLPGRFRVPVYHRWKESCHGTRSERTHFVTARFPMARCIQYCMRCYEPYYYDGQAINEAFDDELESLAIRNPSSSLDASATFVSPKNFTLFFYCSSCAEYQCSRCALSSHQDVGTREHRLVAFDVSPSLAPIAPQHVVSRGVPGDTQGVLHINRALSDHSSVITSSSRTSGSAVDPPVIALRRRSVFS